MLSSKLAGQDKGLGDGCGIGHYKGYFLEGWSFCNPRIDAWSYSHQSTSSPSLWREERSGFDCTLCKENNEVGHDNGEGENERFNEVSEFAEFR